MISQIVFLVILLVSFGVLGYSFSRVFKIMKQLKPFKISEIGKRFVKMMDVAIIQTKILKRPVIGLMHALVFWGFLVILVGSIEMIIDGLTGTERVLSVLGVVYDVIIAGGDIFALVIAVFVFIFILRRTIFHVSRFEGKEMTKKSHNDALFALGLIFILMISLLGINTFYNVWVEKSAGEFVGLYPVSSALAGMFDNMSVEQAHIWYKINWWTHILVIFFFANILPYSKHFHVFMSVPNVFFSRLQPLGKMDTMENIKEEVKSMMNPDLAFADNGADSAELERFGVLDAQDVSWKNYLDSLACTQCGRCTSVCPANTTGKLLSPRKIVMDLRARMKEKTPSMLKGDKNFDDGRSLLGDFITEEELWACTTCNACAYECPISINHPQIILEMRRYLVMEKSSAPSGLNTVFQNIENNGAPWQFNCLDRMLWAENIELNGKPVNVPIISELPEDKQAEYLLWVGSSGAFDDRYKKVMQHFVKILHHLNVNYAVLGVEESDSGDVARRAGNEMLFQMQAMTNIELMNAYNVKKIITCDPHDYNTLKHDYPDFEGNYEVIHHTEFLRDLINNGILNLKSEQFSGKKVTFHDPCYLGRINGEVAAPRLVLKSLNVEVKEMKRHGKNSFCCGAGGGQMFKEAEKGDKEVFIERTEEAIETDAEIIVTACPFCMTMLTDGIKYKNQEEKMKNYDIAELVSIDLGL
ncbi:MAG: 4Fe-4S dicluster domain-containing protein [Bacteroidales bacterium]|nr:4Fe-4S dicluster domain-containing protein [Bacteroidales bacterium]